MLRKVTWIQLGVCLFSVVLSAWVYNLATGTEMQAWPAWWPLEMAILVLTCWLAIAFFSDGGRELRTSFDCFFSAVGFMLLGQYGLTYFFYWALLPWGVLLGGSSLAVTLCILLASPANPREQKKILLLGFDSTSRALSPALRERIVGVIDDDPAQIPPDMPF